MNAFVMGGAEQSVLFHHMAFYGLADILDTTGVTGVKLKWDGPRPVITADQLNPETVEEAVRTHIQRRRPWVTRTTGPDRSGRHRAVMSPRLTVFKSDAAWKRHQIAREEILDELTTGQAWPDLRYLAALGEPCYWRFTPRQKRMQHDAASRLDMQPRQQGSEFVGTRLRRLTEKLLARKTGQIVAGLDDSNVIDEIGENAPSSLSATGLNMPGPVDNALVWCALWGIGQLPLSLRTDRAAATSGHLECGRREWFYVPVWNRPWHPARLRSILASEQLRQAATTQIGTNEIAARAAKNWLRARSVIGVLRFPIGRFGNSDQTTERRALRGEAIPL